MADFTPFHGQSFGARFGTTVGRAIGQGAGNAFQSGLDRLAEQQLFQVNQHRAQQAQQALQSRYISQGFSPEEAGFFSLLGDKAPDILKSAVEKGFWPGASQQAPANTPSQPQQSNAPQNVQTQPSRPQMMSEKQPAVQVGSQAQYQPPYAEAPGAVQQNGPQIPGVPAGVEIPDYLAKAVAPQPRTGNFREAAMRGKAPTPLEAANAITSYVKGEQDRKVAEKRANTDQDRLDEQVRHNKAQEIQAAADRGVKFQELGDRRTERQQIAINKEFQKYDDTLDARYRPAEQAAQKLGVMQELLAGGDELTGSQVSENLPTSRLPNFLLNTASKRFNEEGKDVASLLTGLQSGAQTISKINYNESRKPNLTQDRATQYHRISDAMQEVGKVVLEKDIRDYLVALNDSQIPKDLTGKINQIYKKSPKIPPVPKDAQQDDVFEDPKSGIRWIVRGPLMRFHGLLEKGKK